MTHLFHYPAEITVMSKNITLTVTNYNDQSFSSKVKNDILTVQEKEYIKNAVSSRCREFEAGRYSLKTAYFKHKKEERSNFREISVLKTEYGQPFIVGKSCGVSITHDAGLAAAAVSNNSSIG